LPGRTPAKTANPAKTRISIDAAAESASCEGLRKIANSQPPSQKFAALRNPQNAAKRKYPCGSSQLSQNSQGVLGTIASDRPYRLSQADADSAHAQAWNDAACARFVARVALFLRRGINATDADDLAEGLHLRDLQGDDRALCLECWHLTGRPGAWHCGNHRAAGVGRELPAELATLPQRCPEFMDSLP
jgi:hypothetical protein